MSKPPAQGPKNILPTLEAEERAGIIEFSGNLSRAEAERLAREEWEKGQNLCFK